VVVHSPGGSNVRPRWCPKPTGADAEYRPSTTLVASHMNGEPSSTPDELLALAHLEAERVLILHRLAGLRRGFQEIVDASADSNDEDEHDPEGSTIAYERSQLAALIQQTGRHLDDI
jgi:hypothetical protein